MEKYTKKQFETPEIELHVFKNRDAILTENSDKDDLGGWSPDII